MRRSFDLAPMSPLIRGVTIVLLALPLGFAAGAVGLGLRALWIPAVFLAVTFAVVWLAARPVRFEAGPGSIAMRFPLWTRSVPDIASARLVTARELRESCGFMLRVGVGGLWGGFGWLWTTRRGLIEFYISRTDGFVLAERRQGRLLLLTPDDPRGLVQVVAPGA